MKQQKVWVISELYVLYKWHLETARAQKKILQGKVWLVAAAFLFDVNVFIQWINYLWSGLSIKLLLHFYLLVLKHCLCGWAKWFCSIYPPCQLATSVSPCVCSTLFSCHMTWSRAVTPVILLLVNVSSAIKIAMIPSTEGSSMMLSELFCLPCVVEIKFFTSRKGKYIWNSTESCCG